jgi:hypothetical protein
VQYRNTPSSDINAWTTADGPERKGILPASKGPVAADLDLFGGEGLVHQKACKEAPQYFAYSVLANNRGHIRGHKYNVVRDKSKQPVHILAPHRRAPFVTQSPNRDTVLFVAHGLPPFLQSLT